MENRSDAPKLSNSTAQLTWRGAHFGLATLSSKQLVLIVYLLYFVGYFTGITAVIGVIIAHLKVGTAEPLLSAHYSFQIRTFWIGFLYMLIGAILTSILVGIAVLTWWFIWSLIRNIKGVLALNENQPIGKPASWMFG